MLKSRFVLVSCVVAALGLATTTSPARAGGQPHTMYLTFSAPFALPGVALPAGTYVFQVVMPGSLDVVQISSRDGKRVYYTAFTRRVLRPAGLRANRQVTFNEVPRGVTPSIKAWFPIDDSIGHEFIYSPNSRQRVAVATN